MGQQMTPIAFGISNLFNHDRRPVYLPDGTPDGIPIIYARDGRWQVRTVDTQVVLFETGDAVSMAAWLNNHEVSAK